MNEQNNNYNSQLNNQNQAPQPVKNRFFSPDLFEDSSASSVGSSVSNQVSNKVISWGVGGSNSVSQNNNVNNSVINKSLNNYQGELMEQVNGVVYTDEQPEILDDSFLYDNNTLNNQEGNFTLQDSPLFQSTIDNSQNNVNVVTNNSSPSFEQNNNGESDWMMNQPLSPSSLGVSVENQNNHVEVEDQNRFINMNTPVLNEQTQVEQYQQQALQQGNQIVLEDPLPEIDMNKLTIDYIGSKYTKISMAPFSFSAFLFGGTYFIYRKMYFMGLIICLINILIFYFGPFPYQLIAYFIIAIVISLIANPLYIKAVNRRVKKIRKKHSKDNQINLSMICKKKGKNNILLFFLSLIVYGSVISFLTYANIVPKVTDLIKETRDKDNVVNEEKYKFDGNILFEEYDIEDTFSIIVPNGFVKDESSIFKYHYTDTSSVGENNTCTLTFSKVYGFDNSEDAIEEIALYNGVSEDVDKVLSNGIEWNTVAVEGEKYDTHYRTMMVGSDVLLFQYESGADVSFGVCDMYLVDVMSTLSLKSD